MTPQNKSLVLGCVADDFTGAGDAASFLAAGGLRTVLTNGIPDRTFAVNNVDAIVIALKSRTQNREAAVADTMAAFDHLRDQGAKTLYFKYCSTFDSTPRGNIGPVIDAVLERYNLPYTVICPALPVNGRTVREGVLYVNGVPLAESHMRHHPLTPMWASQIPALMAQQGMHPCHVVNASLLNDSRNLENQVATLTKKEGKFYLVPDYFEPEHGRQIATCFGELTFLTGGSGLAGDLAAHLSGGAPAATKSIQVEQGAGRLILAGSCSLTTQRQVRYFIESGGASQIIHPAELLDGRQTVRQLLVFVADHKGQDVLLYSAGSGGGLECTATQEQEAALLEKTIAEVACRSVEAGWRRLIVAGGETSGAVIQALGYRYFYIGPNVAPGVPMMIPTDDQSLVLALKSGNFGGEDFFSITLQGRDRS